MVLRAEFENNSVTNGSRDACWGIGELSVSANQNAMLLRGDGMSRGRAPLVAAGRSPMTLSGSGVGGCRWGSCDSSVAGNGQIFERLEGLGVVVGRWVNGEDHA